MALLSKEALLGASDLAEREVELPSIGGSVKVRALPAAYSNEATSQALKLVTGARGEQIATVDTAKLEILQVLHGLVEPRLGSLQEAEQFAQRCGPAFKAVVSAIDELSGVDKEAIEQASATFRPGVASAPGSDVGDAASNGSSGPVVHSGTGA